MVFAEHGSDGLAAGVSIAINGSAGESVFAIHADDRWQLEFGTAGGIKLGNTKLRLPAFSLAVLLFRA